jgi:hypothetical protein
MSGKCGICTFEFDELAERDFINQFFHTNLYNSQPIEYLALNNFSIKGTLFSPFSNLRSTVNYEGTIEDVLYANGFVYNMLNKRVELLKEQNKNPPMLIENTMQGIPICDGFILGFKVFYNFRSNLSKVLELVTY